MNDPRYKNGIKKQQLAYKPDTPETFGWTYRYWHLSLKAMVYVRDGFFLSLIRPGTENFPDGGWLVETPTGDCHIFTEATLSEVNDWVNLQVETAVILEAA